MSEDRVDELAKETQEDTTPKSPEEKTESEETDVPELNPEELQAKLAEIDEKLKKAEEVNENYKRELQKYRKKTLSDEPVKPEGELEPEVEEIKKNFLSKKQDVLSEFDEEINSLGESQFEKVKSLIKATTDTVYEKALKENRYVAVGEIKTAVKDLLEFAKGKPASANPEELRKAENAEISGVKPSTSSAVDTTALDKRNAELSGRTPEEERAIREKREARLKDYEVKSSPLDKIPV